MINKYKKYCPNVFVMESTEEYNRGDIAEIETKYGKITEVIIFNKVYEIDDKKYYSQIRADGYNMQERAKMKAGKYENWSDSAMKKSNQSYEKANSHSDFLSLGEPVKVGHHSEKRHRKIIENANNNMRKSVEYNEKAEAHNHKAEYWKSKENDINLSMPESIDFYSHKLEEAKTTHKLYKDNPEKRKHSYSLTYAKKKVNEAEKQYNTALKLWGTN